MRGSGWFVAALVAACMIFSPASAQDETPPVTTEAATAAARRDIVATPSVAAHHARLGYLLRYAGLNEQSIAAYRGAQAIDPGLEALIATEGQIAKALLYQGDYAGALAAHATFSGYLTRLGRARDEKMLFYEGVARLYAGHDAKAVTLFDASIAADRGSIWSRFAEGYKRLALEDRSGLLALARELEPRADVADGERRYRLAHFYAAGGNEVAAIRNLAAAIDAGFFNVRLRMIRRLSRFGAARPIARRSTARASGSMRSRRGWHPPEDRRRASYWRSTVAAGCATVRR